jgi:hypothetical protein
MPCESGPSSPSSNKAAPASPDTFDRYKPFDAFLRASPLAKLHSGNDVVKIYLRLASNPTVALSDKYPTETKIL